MQQPLPLVASPAAQGHQATEDYVTLPDLSWFVDLNRLTDPYFILVVVAVRLIRYGNKIAGLT